MLRAYSSSCACSQSGAIFFFQKRVQPWYIAHILRFTRPLNPWWQYLQYVLIYVATRNNTYWRTSQHLQYVLIYVAIRYNTHSCIWQYRQYVLIYVAIRLNTHSYTWQYRQHVLIYVAIRHNTHSCAWQEVLMFVTGTHVRKSGGSQGTTHILAALWNPLFVPQARSPAPLNRGVWQHSLRGRRGLLRRTAALGGSDNGPMIGTVGENVGKIRCGV